jgi:peptidoglycan-associated lipoprotein
MLRKLLAGLIVVVGLAGCASTPPESEAGAAVEDRSATQTTPGGVTTAPIGSGGPSGTTGLGTGTQAGGPGAGGPGSASVLRDPANILSRRFILFDYDSYVVKDEFRPLIQAHGKYLADNRNARMRLEGHTDERGSREYNIALGQRRSEAVKRMLLATGATDAQIETVSFGKEKPRNPASNEAAWAENRRVEIFYQGE